MGKDITYGAVVADSFDGPKDVRMGERERVPLGPREARVAVRAAGVNFADLMAVSGTHQDNPPPPFVTGFEAAGEVVETGEAVTLVAAGDRIMCGADYGAFATELVIDERLCAPIPEGRGFAEAATLPVAFGTGYTALVQRAGLRAADWLLIMGAGGNIGGGALQVGRMLGARTIAPGGGREACDRLRKLGADHVIDYHEDTISERVREITGGHGADVVFDAVTGKAFSDTHAALAKLGRHVIAGAAGGEPPDVPMMSLITNIASVVGIDWQHFVRLDPDVAQEALGTVARWWARGWIAPPPFETRPLEDAPVLLAEMADGKAAGKVVLTVGDA